MNCPGCRAPIEAQDNFCIACGRDLRPAAPPSPRGVTHPPAAPPPQHRESGGLDPAALAAFGASRECSSHSPLIPYRGTGPAAPSPPPVADDLLAAVCAPQRSCVLLETTREDLRRDILLVRESTCCRWFQQGERVWLTREAAPREFLRRVGSRLSSHISDGASWNVELSPGHLRTLKGIRALCEALSRVDPAAAFVTYGQLGSFLGTPDGLRAHVAALVGQGLVGLAGGQDPLISLAPLGDEVLGDLASFDAYYILQARGEEADAGYPSLHFSARRGHLSMVTSTAGEAVVIRTLDAPAVESLVNWAWVQSARPA